MKYLLWLSVALQLINGIAGNKTIHFAAEVSCEDLLTTQISVYGDDNYCKNLPENLTVMGYSLVNLALLGGAHCYNNGSGLCKGFAGQFEFYFNVFEDKLIGPVPESSHVGKFGMHKRVPITYNVKGQIVYADRVINWSREFKKQHSGKQLSLLSVKDFNWCEFTENDLWPYKSSIYDLKSKGRYHVYFFNGQTCIYDKSTGKRQHFNTRFQKPTGFVLDHAINPLIFAMEDNLAKDIRVVKHQATYWYEVGYEILDLRNVSGKKTNYQVKFDDLQRKPCHFDGKKGMPFSKKAIRDYWFKNGDRPYCITDLVHLRFEEDLEQAGWKHRCGADDIEWVDDPRPNVVHGKGPLVYSYLDKNMWTIRNKQYIINARTSIPLSNTAIKEIVLFHYGNHTEVTPENELFPVPMMTTFTSNYKPQEKEGEEFFVSNETEMLENAKQWPLMNYVDDIAYLYKCDTILVILGSLYTELKKDQFDLQTKAPIGSIYDLGAWELIIAFYNVPDTNQLVFYHRQNYVAIHEYNCAKDQNSLVTARKVGKYMYAYGVSAPRNLFARDIAFYTKDFPRTRDFRDETFFETIRMIKGQIPDPDAPNPDQYPLAFGPPPGPQEASESNDYIWIIVGVGVLLIVAMCAACFMIFLRRRKRATKRNKPPKSQLSVSPTKRSSFHSSGVSKTSTNPSISRRSSLSSKTRSKPASRSQRSALTSNSSSRTKPKKNSSISRVKTASSHQRSTPAIFSSGNRVPSSANSMTNRSSSSKSRKN